MKRLSSATRRAVEGRRAAFLRLTLVAVVIGAALSSGSFPRTTTVAAFSGVAVSNRPTKSREMPGGSSTRTAFAHRHRHQQPSTTALPMTIVSPFDDSREGGASSSSTTATTTTTSAADSATSNLGGGGGPLDLTWENVELVLDEMRPFLIQDGGNVKIADIDGPVVRLQLEGACGTCPSSTQTMKMGLERGLRERIPEIQEVVQSLPEGPPLDADQVDVILDGVRPFLKVAGGTIDLDRFEGLDGLQPTIWLKMGGASSTLNSVKLEIAQRLQRHFMVAGLRVEWVE